MFLIERLIAEAKVLAGGDHQCEILGHDWKHVGGCNCGCEDGWCSIPVYECRSCGDVDYGENDEADKIKEICNQNKNDFL